MIPLFLLVFCEIRPLLAPRVNQALYPVAGPDDPTTSGSPGTKITLKGFVSSLLDDEVETSGPLTRRAGPVEGSFRCSGSRKRGQVTQPVSSPTSAGERPRAQNWPNPPISSAHERPRALGSYLISVRSVVRVYPGPLMEVEIEAPLGLR